MFLVLKACQDYRFLSVLSYVKTVVNIMFYLVPAIAILFIGFRVAKIVMSGDPGNKDHIKPLVSKIIALVAVFFVPTLVSLLASLLSNSGIGVAVEYDACMEHATSEYISFYRAKEEAEDKVEEQKKAQENKVAEKERKKVDETREKARKENEKIAEEERKKQEAREAAEDAEDEDGDSSSGEWNGELIDGTAQSWKDVVWDPNDVTKISNLTAAQLKKVLEAKGGNATNFIPLINAYITNEHTNKVNAIFFLSLHAIESGWVTSSVSNACNNLGGWKDFGNPSKVCARAPANEGSTPYKWFNSKGDFVMEVGSSMHKHYLTPGGSHYHGPSVRGIIHDYNCQSESEVQSIISIGNDLFSYVKRVV